MRHKLCCSIGLLVPYQHFLKTVYNLRKVKKTGLVSFCPSGVRLDLREAKKDRPIANSWIARYLATLHQISPHNKKKKKNMHFSLFFACFVSFSFFFFACVSFLVLLLIWLCCLFVQFVSQSVRLGQRKIHFFVIWWDFFYVFLWKVGL